MLADADPIVQAAIMDASYEMMEDRYNQQDLESILAKAAKGGDASEEFYMTARLAPGRVKSKGVSTLFGTLASINCKWVLTPFMG